MPVFRGIGFRGQVQGGGPDRLALDLSFCLAVEPSVAGWRLCGLLRRTVPVDAFVRAGYRFRTRGLSVSP